jgi:hypothetical protein
LIRKRGIDFWIPFIVGGASLAVIGGVLAIHHLTNPSHPAGDDVSVTGCIPAKSSSAFSVSGDNISYADVTVHNHTSETAAEYIYRVDFLDNGALIGSGYGLTYSVYSGQTQTGTVTEGTGPPIQFTTGPPEPGHSKARSSSGSMTCKVATVDRELVPKGTPTLIP